MQLDRSKAPQNKPIDKISLIKPIKYLLHNGIPMHIINAGTEDLVKVELIFPAGGWYQNRPLLSLFTSLMLNEGTKKHSSPEIAELFDFYGAYVDFTADKDFASASIFTLNKHLETVLNLIYEILTESIFPEDELQILLANKKQEFIVSNEKVGNIAFRKFEQMIFGESHPYGRKQTLNDYNTLTQPELITFYKNHFTFDQLQIIVAGKVTDTEIEVINKVFGNIPISRLDAITKPLASYTLPEPSSVYIEKEDAVQSAIRIGSALFNINHPDYPSMQVLNTIFGGYFGSRLMTNIRENKGYTYGISSKLISFKQNGYLVISTETGVDYTNKVVDEIYLEIKRLQTELVYIDELTLVKNYLTGVFLQSADGPFGLAALFKKQLLNNLSFEFYETYLETIQTITSAKIMEMANNYLNEKNLSQLIVGRK